MVPLLLTNFAAIFGAFVACFEYLNVNWVIFPVLHSQKDKSMRKNKIGIKEFFEYWNRDFLIKFSQRSLYGSARKKLNWLILSPIFVRCLRPRRHPSPNF